MTRATDSIAMATTDDSDETCSLVSCSGDWIVSGSDREGVAPVPKATTGGRRRNPRRKAKDKVGPFRVPSSEPRSDDSMVEERRKRKGVALGPVKAGKKRSPKKKQQGLLPPPPLPPVTAIERRRRRVVLRSDEEEEEKESEDEVADDPVALMRAMVRLPGVLVQVRKYGSDIVAVCDQMQGLLLEDGKDEEMEELKRKLNRLSEKCYQKVQSELNCGKPKEPQPRLSRRDKHKPKPVVESDDDTSPIRPPPRLQQRSNSIDYTEYVSPDRSGGDLAPPEDPADQPDDSAKDSGNPSSGQDESPCKTVVEVVPEVDEPQDMEVIRDNPVEDAPESCVMDITEPDPDCNIFFDTELMAEVCPPPTDSMMNETSIVNDDIFAGLQNDHDAYTTPIHREAVPPPQPARPASPKKRVTQESNTTTDTPTTSMGSRPSVDAHRRRVLPADAPVVVQQSLDKYFPKKSVETVDQPPVNEDLPDEEVEFVSATAGRRQKTDVVMIKPEPEPKSQVLPTPEYTPEPGPSKAPAETWMARKMEPKGPKFVTNSDPNPNREPTTEEIQYIVPHQPKFSVPPQPQGENPELELMKREIECRLRVNELSWVTQRAIREEYNRAKKVERNNEKLGQQLARFQTTMPENQLILDYDAESQTFIRVHPELVEKLKPHQREGVKFMYDCCYGGVSDIKNSNGSGCILAHCMGLGKTLQVIALMNTVVCYPKMKTKRIIVICPKSTVMNWAQEIQLWLGDIQSGVKLKVFYLPDSSNIYKKLEVLRGFHTVTGRTANVLLIGYEAFRSLVFYDAGNRKGEKHSDGVRTEVRRVLINPGADLVILDEGHIIKNRKSQTNLAVAEVATKRRIILTGTPIQNNLNEYYCMVNFVKPAYLGSEREFNEHYATPIKKGQHADSDIHEVAFMKMQSYILHKNLVNFVQRKEFEVLRGFLPDKFEYVLYVPLTPVQEDLYEQYLKRNPLRQETGGIHLLEDYTFMRKIWTHPIVLEKAWETAMKKKYGVQERQRAVRRAHGFDSSSDDDEDNDADRARSITNVWWKQIISADDLESLFPSNKMILLFEILRMCQERGEKCLIFSGFVMVLNMVEHFMKMIDEQATNPKAALYGFSKFRGPWRPGMDFYRIDGGTSKSTRHEMVTKFNDPKNRVTRVFLISTKAGGQGINLVGANRVIILDTSWNPAVDQQGIFRIYRLGQQKTCYIYRLLAMHTMEEKVYSRAVTKQAMSHRVADKKQVDRNYSMADLEELYHFERVDMAARPNAAPAEDDLLSSLLWNHHKLIYRYHMHETMLDNKTEKDLTEIEKQVAWNQFKSKGLAMSGGIGSGLGGLGPTDSQLSDPDGDSQVLTELDLACAPTYEDDVKVEESPLPPLAIPVRQIAAGAKATTTPNKKTIFGDDPYNTIYGGGMSIIEEQRQRLSLQQPEPAVPTASQVTVSPAEVELLRDLEEGSVAVKEEDQYEPPAKKPSLEVPILDTVDLLNLSYEGDTEEQLDESRTEQHSTEMDSSIPPSIPALKSDSFSSMIEYDPVGSTQEFSTYNTTTVDSTSVDQTVPPPPSSYEKFKASMLEDPSVTTSTTAASPVAVTVVASSPAEALAVPPPRMIMTRSMKRTAAPLKASSGVPAKKKICAVGDGCLSKASWKENRCRALVPFTGPRFVMNSALKAYLARAADVAPTNPCTALVPYVPRKSLLETILAEASDRLSSIESDSEDDSSSTDSGSSTATTESMSDDSSYPIGLLTQTSTLSWTATDLAALDEHISEYYTAHSDLEDGAGGEAMDFTQHTLTDSQREAVQMAQAQKEHAELMATLHETRQVVTQDILAEERILAVVPYNPPVSLLAKEEERTAQDEPKTVVFHANLTEVLSRGTKRKREQELPSVKDDSVIWKKPRSTKVYRAKRRAITTPVVSIPTTISVPPIEDPEPTATRAISPNTTLSWGDEEVDFVDYNISSGEIEECEKARQQQPSTSSELVPYEPPVVAIYGPVRSFWVTKALSTLLINERHGQILKAHHNKLFRFAPYDKRDRKWRTVKQVVEIKQENTCRSLVLYTGGGSQREEPTARYLLHPLLVGYLSFCRAVTQHSTMMRRDVSIRGEKRRRDWWDSMTEAKRPCASSSAP